MIGIIGTGNMGGALAGALAGSGCKLGLSDVSAERVQTLADSIGAEVSDNRTLAKTADILFLGVKPQTLPKLLGELRSALWARGSDFLLVSMATGVTIERVKALCESPKLPVIRIMPNLAVSVGAGTILYSASPEVTQEQLDAFLKYRDSLKKATLAKRTSITEQSIGNLFLNRSISPETLRPLTMCLAANFEFRGKIPNSDPPRRNRSWSGKARYGRVWLRKSPP